MAKETYLYGKRALVHFLQEKTVERTMDIAYLERALEAYLYGKRAL